MVFNLLRQFHEQNKPFNVQVIPVRDILITFGYEDRDATTVFDVAVTDDFGNFYGNYTIGHGESISIAPIKIINALNVKINACRSTGGVEIPVSQLVLVNDSSFVGGSVLLNTKIGDTIEVSIDSDMGVHISGRSNLCIGVKKEYNQFHIPSIEGATGKITDLQLSFADNLAGETQAEAIINVLSNSTHNRMESSNRSSGYSNINNTYRIPILKSTNSSSIDITLNTLASAFSYYFESVTLEQTVDPGYIDLVITMKQDKSQNVRSEHFIFIVTQSVPGCINQNILIQLDAGNKAGVTTDFDAIRMRTKITSGQFWNNYTGSYNTFCGYLYDKDLDIEAGNRSEDLMVYSHTFNSGDIIAKRDFSYGIAGYNDVIVTDLGEYINPNDEVLCNKIEIASFNDGSSGDRRIITGYMDDTPSNSGQYVYLSISALEMTGRDVRTYLILRHRHE